MFRKSIIFFMSVAFAVLTVSCNSLSLQTPSVDQNEISFGSKGLGLRTKAFTESTNSTLQSNGFKAAVVIDSDNSTMFNTAVTYGSSVYRVPGKVYYYPLGSTISAYGVYPLSESITIAADGTAKVSYTQNADKDLIAAYARNVSKSNNAIEMDFDHILSLVNIKCQGEDTNADYVLKSISVATPQSGTYVFTSGWSALGTETAYSYFADAGRSVSTSSMQAFGSSMSFIPGTATIRVVWDCKIKDTDILVGQYDQSLDVTLTKGKHTTFNLTLPNSDAMEIKFTVNVTNWIDEEQSYVVTKDKTVSIRYTDIPDGYAASGISGTFSKTAETSNDLSIGFAGINTKSSESAGAYSYKYAMFLSNQGYMYSKTAPSGYYVKKVTVTFGANTGESGLVGFTFGSSALSTRNSTVSEHVYKGGSCVAYNSNQSYPYWNFSTRNSNVQIDGIEIVYSPKD